jgi:hypothetical protein
MVTDAIRVVLVVIEEIQADKVMAIMLKMVVHDLGVGLIPSQEEELKKS